MLYGAPRPCREDAQCPGKVCTFGVCLGLIQLDERWTQETVLEELRRRLQGQDEARATVIAMLEEELDRRESDVAYRARALLGLERLGARAPIAKALGDREEPLQEAAALALVRLGDPRGLGLTAALTEHDAEALACEAILALGQSGLPDALPHLLGLLSPELPRERVRGAVLALARLRDRRAIGPLVGFLETGPETLALSVVETLRVLSGARIGQDGAAWRAWLASADVAPAPPYRLMRTTPKVGFGLPDP
jgi:HEAT repeat protein